MLEPQPHTWGTGRRRSNDEGTPPAECRGRGTGATLPPAGWADNGRLL